MVGGGIGVTPYASILNDLVFGTSTNRYSGVACKKVSFCDKFRVKQMKQYCKQNCSIAAIFQSFHNKIQLKYYKITKICFEKIFIKSDVILTATFLFDKRYDMSEQIILQRKFLYNFQCMYNNLRLLNSLALQNFTAIFKERLISYFKMEI